MNKIGAIILGAGSGTRLNNGQPSEKPKILYEIAGQPMVSFTLELLNQLGISEKVLVVGHKAELVQEAFAGKANFVLQEERKGTAHAAKLGEGELSVDITHLLIIQGDDSAFYRSQTLEEFISQAVNFKISFTTVRVGDPTQYGRVIRNEIGEVEAIVEKESVTEEQTHINEVNAATYFVERDWFNTTYKELKPSAVGKGELIMPDMISIAFKENLSVLGFEVPQDEWVGINTPEELEKANRLMAERQKDANQE